MVRETNLLLATILFGTDDCTVSLIFFVYWKEEGKSEGSKCAVDVCTYVKTFFYVYKIWVREEGINACYCGIKCKYIFYSSIDRCRYVIGRMHKTTTLLPSYLIVPRF